MYYVFRRLRLYLACLISYLKRIASIVYLFFFDLPLLVLELPPFFDADGGGFFFLPDAGG